MKLDDLIALLIDARKVTDATRAIFRNDRLYLENENGEVWAYFTNDTVDPGSSVVTGE